MINLFEDVSFFLGEKHSLIHSFHLRETKINYQTECLVFSWEK